MGKEKSTDKPQVMQASTTNIQKSLQKFKTDNPSIAIAIDYASRATIVTYGFDKYIFTKQIKGQIGLYAAIRFSLKRPVLGYTATLLYTGLKSCIKFPLNNYLKTELDTINPDGKFNNNVAGFFAAVTAASIMTPFSVTKAFIFADKTSSEFFQLKPRALLRGMPCIWLREGAQWSTFFGMYPVLIPQFHNPVFAGGVAGIMGAVVSHPFAVIAQNQKVNGGTMAEQLKGLIAKEGVRALGRGIVPTLFRMGSVSAIAASFITDTSNKTNDRNTTEELIAPVQLFKK